MKIQRGEFVFSIVTFFLQSPKGVKGSKWLAENCALQSSRVDARKCEEKITAASELHFVDPEGRPTVTACSDHCFCPWCLSVHFSKSPKTKQFSSETSVRYWA